MKTALFLCVCLLFESCARPAVKSGAVDALFRDYSQPSTPGASVAVIRDGKVVYQHAYGMADVEAKVVATTAANYRLASLTKQFTAMAILILADRKLLSLDARITAFFPDFPDYGKGITVRHLLNHTSGLRDYSELVPPDRTAQLKDLDVLNLLKQQSSTYFPPGSEWRYSNTGYAFLALIVEKVSGMPFAAFLEKEIFDPLHMSGSVAYEEGVSTIQRRAYGYSKSENGFTRTDQSVTSAVLGDGGVYSSVEDLYRWDQSLYTTRLVSAANLQQAFTPATLTNGGETSYAFGWEIGEYRGLKVFMHSGGTIGFRTHIRRFPEKRFTVIVLTNRTDARPDQLADRISDLYLF